MKLASKSYLDKEFWSGKKVLVTGHTGFKGSWLSLWLLKMGSQVSGISLAPENSQNLFDLLSLKKNINHFIFDIRNADLLDKTIKLIKPDIIFHLAAQPLVIKSYENPLLTWETNLIGSLNLMNSITSLDQECSAVFITTDKVYKNNEWNYGYRENDQLGGGDPYSASKAASELAVDSWRSSFCGNLAHQTKNLFLTTARSGNVIGGGDWSHNRLIPDIVRAIESDQEIIIRNPYSTRPWQHVLEPLFGYLLLAEKLSKNKGKLSTSFNFGPLVDSNKSVLNLVKECCLNWKFKYKIEENINVPYEAKMLHLVVDKAYHELGWKPKFSFSETVSLTMQWYKNLESKTKKPLEKCLENLDYFIEKV